MSKEKMDTVASQVALRAPSVAPETDCMFVDMCCALLLSNQCPRKAWSAIIRF